MNEKKDELEENALKVIEELISKGKIEETIDESAIMKENEKPEKTYTKQEVKKFIQYYSSKGDFPNMKDEQFEDLYAEEVDF